MMCPRCEQFYKKYPLQDGDDGKEHRLKEGVFMGPVRCAFEKGIFNHDNWNCETMNVLRERCDYEFRDDTSAGSFGVIHIPDVEAGGPLQQGYIVMTWYKQRGTTGRAYVVNDDDEPAPLTLTTAEHVISKKSEKLGLPHETLGQIFSGRISKT